MHAQSTAPSPSHDVIHGGVLLTSHTHNDTTKITKSAHRSVYVRTVHDRWTEVRSAGVKIEERKLGFHVLMIILSAILTVAGTLAVFQLWHLGMVIPALPSIVQEVWDWIFKQ